MGSSTHRCSEGSFVAWITVAPGNGSPPALNARTILQHCLCCLGTTTGFLRLVAIAVFTQWRSRRNDKLVGANSAAPLSLTFEGPVRSLRCRRQSQFWALPRSSWLRLSYLF